MRPNVGHATVQKLTPESATLTLHVKEGCISNFIDHIFNLLFHLIFSQLRKASSPDPNKVQTEICPLGCALQEYTETRDKITYQVLYRSCLR